MSLDSLADSGRQIETVTRQRTMSFLHFQLVKTERSALKLRKSECRLITINMASQLYAKLLPMEGYQMLQSNAGHLHVEVCL